MIGTASQTKEERNPVAEMRDILLKTVAREKAVAICKAFVNIAKDIDDKYGIIKIFPPYGLKDQLYHSLKYRMNGDKYEYYVEENDVETGSCLRMYVMHDGKSQRCYGVSMPIIEINQKQNNNISFYIMIPITDEKENTIPSIKNCMFSMKVLLPEDMKYNVSKIIEKHIKSI